MKTITYSIIMAIVGFGIAYLIFASNDVTPVGASATAKQQYTCGMHPEIISDEPGYCPICSMKLTPKKDGSSTSSAGIQIDPTTSHNMGIITAIALYQNLSRKIHAFGEVAYSEPNLYDINFKVEGWVEKLYADETGQQVSKGKPLLEIYSPKLIAAQEEYIHAKNSANGATNILAAAKKRLSNWDLSDSQIADLSDKSDIKRTITIYSPTSGIIVNKNITDGELIKPGKELYQIADLSTVWVRAYVYEQDVPYLSPGQKATINFPNIPEQKFTGSINYISPFLNSKRQVEIRIELNNDDNLLRPEMYAEVSIESQLSGKRLTIPYSAVIHSGTKKVIYLKENENSYLPQIINTGAIGDNDLIEVTSGLEEGQQVVTSGQFMLDSESRLNEALSGGMDMGHNHGSMVAAEMSPEDHSSHDKQKKVSPVEEKTDSGVYTCPMPSHFHILQFGKGKCPECGMNLVPIEETENDTAYICPMPEDKVVQSEPDQCPKCNMKLIPLELDSKKTTTSQKHSMETIEEMGDKATDEMVAIGGHDIHTCPMPSHYDQLQYGKGDCSKCGMKLVPLGQTDNKDVYVCPMTECETVQDHKGTCPVCGMNLVRYQAENPEAGDAR